MKKLKAAIVGSGFIATKKHIPAFLSLSKQVDLVAICDLNVEAAKEIAAKNNIQNVYSNLDDLFKDHAVDLIDICTPPRTHAEVAIKAMSNKANVIIEKPMAITDEECKQIIDCAQQNNVKVCVAHSDLFYPPFIKARKLVSEGKIGKVRGMKIFLSTPTDYMTSREDHWANKLPGGVIGESGPHLVYMALAFIHPIIDVKVEAVKRLDYPWSPYEDYRIEFIGRDATCSATSVYTTNQWAAEVDIWGDSGMVRMDLENMSLIQYNRDTLTPKNVALSGLASAAQSIGGILQTGLNVVLGKYKKTHDIIIEEFIKSILSGAPSPVSAEEGKEAVRVMNAMIDSLNKGS